MLGIIWFGGAKYLAMLASFILIEYCHKATSISCKQCDKKYGSCDDGTCSGKTCVLVEAVNTQYRSVIKTCSSKIQDKSECFVTYPDGIESVHCYCIYDYCNSDEELKRSGLLKIRQRDLVVNGAAPSTDSSERSKRTNSDNSRTLAISSNSVVVMIFLCFFVSAAFSLLIIHTMC